MFKYWSSLALTLLSVAACTAIPADLPAVPTPRPVATSTSAPGPTPSPTTSPLLSPSPSPSPSPVSSGGVTFLKDVQPLVGRCVFCHGARFNSYEGAKSNLDDIIRVTSTGFMPRSGPPFTPAEVATLKAWKAAGTPEK